MSRAAPFPTASARRPYSPAEYQDPDDSQREQPYSSQVKPLQINRPASHSNTSGISGSPRGPGTSPGPSRPQRSELRGRQISETEPNTSFLPSRDHFQTDSSGSSRPDRLATSRLQNRSQPNNSNPNRAPRTRPERSNTGTSEDVQSPTLTAALAAFQSAGSRKRAMTNETDDQEYARERRRDRDDEQQRQHRIRERAPGRRVNGVARAGDIDAILNQIADEWESVLDPEFNTMDLVLQLLDDSSLGKDMDSFRSTKQMLAKALKGSVDKHYQAFAASLPHHASLLGHLELTHSQIGDARTSIQDAKEVLGSKRADLAQLWSRGQMTEEMIRLLDEIEHLKSVPDVLESLMSEKRLLQASVILVRSLKTISKPDMLEIGAVSDLRAYLQGQETALKEILLDELNSHLYLKSFWCESRWAAYIPNQINWSKVEFEDEPLPGDMHGEVGVKIAQSDTTSSYPSRLMRYLNDLALRPNDSPVEVNEPKLKTNAHNRKLSSAGLSSMTSLPSFGNLAAFQNSQEDRNPESDSFAYIETVLESLSVLGKLGNTLDIVTQRLPSEVFSLVESTLEEVAERAEYGRRASMYTPANASTSRFDGILVYSTGESTGGSVGGSFEPGVAPTGGMLNVQSMRLAALESSAKVADHEILNDFFWTVFSKLDAVLQGLRLVYEITNRIGSRRDFKDSSGSKPGALFPIADIWIPIQAEVRTLLYDYLTDGEQGSISKRNPIASINDVLREGKFARDRGEPVFRFGDTDFKMTNKILKSHENELIRVLRDTVPGLVQGSTENAAQATMSSVGTDDRLLGSGQRHQVLIKPNAFHVGVLFQPTLRFLDRVSEILPAGKESVRSSSLVLDEFVLNVYLPQLEEKVSVFFHDAVTGPEAFQPDPSSTRISTEPLVKASTQLMALINSLCVILKKTPFHRESYTRLVLSVMMQFYQRCSDRLQDLVSHRPASDSSMTQIAIAAQWAQLVELHPCLSEMAIVSEHDSGRIKQLTSVETRVERGILGQRKITQTDLLQSTRTLSALCNLYRSISWFAAELDSLKSTPEELFSPTTPLRLEPNSARTPYTPFLPIISPTMSNEPLKLPLSREMGMRFQALLETYNQLANLVLFTIRIDVRCRTLHYLDAAMSHGNYLIDHEAGEPDPHIVDLNTELGQIDNFASIGLPRAQHQFIFAGLGDLMEQQLITYAGNLRLVNNFGINKVMRNVLALQQCLRTIAKDSEDSAFERAKRYYSLFFVSPTDMLDGIRQKQEFTFDEYKVMLNLQCGVNHTQRDAAVNQAANRSYSMYVIDLLELENATESS